MVTASAAPVRPELEALLYGKDPLPRIVALEPSGSDGVILWRRGGDGGLTQERDTFCPWLLCDAEGVAALPAGDHVVRQLDGGGALNRLVEFKRWPAFTAGQRALSDVGVASFSYASLVTQYLIAAGRTLFHDMRFEEVHRLQLDVETSSLKPTVPGSRVLVAALTDNRGFEEVLTATDTPTGEADLLRRIGELIVQLDPDVIEGHNVVDFDLPYIAARAEALGVSLTWGRGGQRVWLQEKQGRLKVGARLLPSVRAHVHGRHILDTFQSVQRFDAEGKLESYALKPVMEALELVRDDREFVDRTSIEELWRGDPKRLARYCLDDARDVRTLAELVTPTDFYQSQIVPRTYQDVATGGTGEKINALMIRAYVGAGHAVAQPEPPRPYPGGYLELRRAGVFRRVVKCDVESLYPAVMLRFDFRPRSDELGVFLPLLGELTERRLDAKRRIRSARGAERAYWNGLSGSYKVLINCFTPGHQVLTPQGFRLVEDLAVGDEVYSLNPANGAREIKRVTHTWKHPYDGPVIQFQHDNVDVEVTPNHRFVLEDHRGRTCFREASELPTLSNYSIPEIGVIAPSAQYAPAPFDVRAHVPHSIVGPDGRLRLRRKTQGAPAQIALQTMLRLLGWYATEGNVYETRARTFATTRRGVTRRITLYQRRAVNPAYHRELQELAVELGLRYRADAYGVSFSCDVLAELLAQQCGHGSAAKRLPPWVFGLDREHIEVLWQTLMKGDGDKEHPRFTTKSPQLADDFCRLSYLLGRKVSVSFDGCYRIWAKRERRVTLRRRTEQFSARMYRGNVYCVTVADNHTLLAGRGYKLNWIGQSFYGYLGYGRANFNDYDAAERVTTTGQELIKKVLAALEARSCEIIEVDTDGVYFVPPPEVEGEAAETVLIEEVGRVLPPGINLAHDGRFAGMVALKQKTYFLLTYDGKLIAKGSSLRSRRDELYLRQFVQDAAVMLINASVEDVSARYLALAKQVQRGELPLEQFSRRESITSKTFSSPGLKRLAAAAQGAAVGQQVRVYQRADGSLALTTEFDRDEDRDYLLRRLHDMAKRFEALLDSKAEFDRLFPKLTAKSDVDAPRPQQLSLFD